MIICNGIIEIWEEEDWKVCELGFGGLIRLRGGRESRSLAVKARDVESFWVVVVGVNLWLGKICLLVCVGDIVFF